MIRVSISAQISNFSPIPTAKKLQMLVPKNRSKNRIGVSLFFGNEQRINYYNPHYLKKKKMLFSCMKSNLS